MDSITNYISISYAVKTTFENKIMQIPNSGFLVAVFKVENGYKYKCFNLFNDELIAKSEYTNSDETFVNYVGLVHCISKSMNLSLRNLVIHCYDLDAILLYDNNAVDELPECKENSLYNEYVRRSNVVISELAHYNRLEEKIVIRHIEKDLHDAFLKIISE